MKRGTDFLGCEVAVMGGAMSWISERNLVSAISNAGGIGRGGLIAGYLEMGAAGVQLGTRFVCAHECIAHPNFKKAFIRASARDAIPSVQLDPRLPVIPVRALKNKEMEAFSAKQREVAALLDGGSVEMAEAQLQIEHYWAGALRRAVIDGDVERGSVMAGQSVGMVTKEEPVAEILGALMAEAAQALERRALPA
jgi:enoyl-[acyl-carrier protein] reductase II